DGIGQSSQSHFAWVGPGYFQTMQTQLLAGRDFSVQNVSPRVAIVNHTFARQFLHGANPIGHTVQMRAAPGYADPSYVIIGMVEDMKYADLREPFQPIAFLFDAQVAQPLSYFNVVLRSQHPVGDLTASVAREVAGVDSRVV